MSEGLKPLVPLFGLAANTIVEMSPELGSGVAVLAATADTSADDCFDLAKSTKFLVVRNDGAATWLPANQIRFVPREPRKPEDPSHVS